MDKTESIRRKMVSEINSNPGERAQLEEKYGKVWDTTEVEEAFEIIGFMAPYVVAREKTTGKKGSLQFQDSPRYYFNFRA